MLVTQTAELIYGSILWGLGESWINPKYGFLCNGPCATWGCMGELESGGSARTKSTLEINSPVSTKELGYTKRITYMASRTIGCTSSSWGLWRELVTVGMLFIWSLKYRTHEMRLAYGVPATEDSGIELRNIVRNITAWRVESKKRDDYTQNGGSG